MDGANWQAVAVGPLTIVMVQFLPDRLTDDLTVFHHQETRNSTLVTLYVFLGLGAEKAGNGLGTLSELSRLVSLCLRARRRALQLLLPLSPLGGILAGGVALVWHGRQIGGVCDGGTAVAIRAGVRQFRLHDASESRRPGWCKQVREQVQRVCASFRGVEALYARVSL